MTQLDSRLGQLVLVSILALAPLAPKDPPIQITTVPPASTGGPDKMDRIAGAVSTDCDSCAKLVLKMIKHDEEGWEAMVPERVVKQVREKCLFGFPAQSLTFEY